MVPNFPLLASIYFFLLLVCLSFLVFFPNLSPLTNLSLSFSLSHSHIHSLTHCFFPSLPLSLYISLSFFSPYFSFKVHLTLQQPTRSTNTTIPHLNNQAERGFVGAGYTLGGSAGTAASSPPRAMGDSKTANADALERRAPPADKVGFGSTFCCRSFSRSRVSCLENQTRHSTAHSTQYTAHSTQYTVGHTSQESFYSTFTSKWRCTLRMR